MFNFFEKSFESGFSTAILNEKGRLVCAKGILKWKDYMEAESLKNDSWKIKAIEGILGECNNLYMPKHEKSLNIIMGATDPEYGGQGLSSSINIDFFKNAKMQGYK